ncbi:MAG TPA: hypothetical protein VK083_20920 [Nocardia sp.]|uniref:hypothetical protein n=1 Tax=Nocardia sp. TaxID=1821 RepID=UPI002B4B6765|nr:hypothetical protein [Nocardia sp.]HLS79251.1 hypothetical protein [Nocardia sp.]
MPYSRWFTRRPLVLAAALAVAGTLSACGSSGDPGHTAHTGTPTSQTTATASPTTTAKPGPTVSDAAAQSLCDAIRPELSNFRVQGPTLGRVGMNLIVHPWGLQHGIDVLNNKSVVDTVTSQTCPEVRQEAIEALEVPDLASVIVGR